MTLINTQVPVVLDVTESNKNFPLIIIIIREPYILKQKSQGEPNNIIALYYIVILLLCDERTDKSSGPLRQHYIIYI